MPPGDVPKDGDGYVITPYLSLTVDLGVEKYGTRIVDMNCLGWRFTDGFAVGEWHTLKAAFENEWIGWFAHATYLAYELEMPDTDLDGYGDEDGRASLTTWHEYLSMKFPDYQIIAATIEYGHQLPGGANWTGEWKNSLNSTLMVW